MDAIPLQGRKEGGKKTQRKQNRWSNLESPMGTSLGKRKHQGLLGCLVQLHRRCTAQLLAVTVSWTTVGLAIPRAEQCRERAPPDLGNIFKVSRPIPHCHLVPPRGPPRSQQLPIGSSSRMGRTDQGRTEVKVKELIYHLELKRKDRGLGLQRGESSSQEDEKRCLVKKGFPVIQRSLWLKKVPSGKSSLPAPGPHLSSFRQLVGEGESLWILNALSFTCQGGTFWGGTFCCPSGEIL